ncbi:hypothetical protein MNBD_GAMMA25-1230, partial [hydrothermal vent metagenome]
LPSVENIEGFVSAHQVAITQLAFDYCNIMIEDSTLRSAFFGNGFDFNANMATAFANKSATIDALATSLYNKMIGSNIGTGPTYTEVRTELSSTVDADGDTKGDGLYEQLDGYCPTAVTNCDDAARTRTIVKSMCTAVLGSAAMLIQ